ncbi:MAG: beta-ketoacyl synthase chain length factor [Bacteroidales bacterium]|nr:beta-ketoacyl synthase chain length factor [Bacteroidales bacterium]
MTANRVYVYGASQLSVQQPLSEDWMKEPIVLEAGYNRSVEPDYRQYIQPLEARRMGKLLKRAVVVAGDALTRAGVTMPDAIVTGTGLGCVESTEFFLDAMCREGESLLKPTYFMQSTHNTISSSLAIRLRCHGYNATYAHKSISFESALKDAVMQVEEESIGTAMVCGFDEVTPSYYGLLKKIGFLGREGEASGESAVAVVIGGKQEGEKAICSIAGLKMLYCPDYSQMRSAVSQMLESAGVKAEEVGGVLLGYNGSERSRVLYDGLRKGALGEFEPLHFKSIFGECYTASALAFYASVCCMAAGAIPEVMRMDVRGTKPCKSILVVNFDDEKNCAITLLK